MEKLSKKVSSRSGNVNAFSAAGTYDDVFGGPPKYSTLSPRIEDYSEIFGGFRGSSIPVLEVPEADVDDADVFLDVTRSFDYSEVFRSLGGGDGDDLAFSSYHDLFVRLHSNGREYGSSDEAWTPAETESLSEDSVTSPHSAQSKSLSNGVSQQSLDNPRQFNLSFHRANPSEEDITTEVHVAQLHAVPGYTFLVDECAPFQRTMFEETHLPGTDNMNLCKHATNVIKRDKNLRKTESQPQDHSFAIHELENGDQREWEICYRDSHSNKAFVSISDISLRTHPSDLPPPSRPPPAFTVRNGYSGELPSNFRARNHEFGWTSDDNAPPVYDVEIDAGSSSFSSAAAMKETMEKAQSKLRSAKEIMERRKEGLGLPSRVKLGMKEGNKSRPFDKFSDMNVDKVFVAPDIDERKIDAFVGEKRKDVKKPINITSNIMEGDKFIFVTEETSMKNESKETWSTEEPCSVYEAGEWKQETEFFELVKRDKPAQGNQEKVCVQNDEVQEHFLERRTYSEVFKRGEESCMRQNVAREAYVGDDQKKFNLAEETRGRVENKKKENVGQEVSWQIEREKKSRKLRKHKEIGQKLSAVDEWKEHDILIEVLEDEHYLDGFHQSGKRYKKISEKGEQEKRTNKSIDIAEDVTRLVHPHVKERSEKKTKASELVGREEASCEKKESQNYLKDVTEKKNQRMSHQGEKQEACEPLGIENKQKASLEIQESERQMEEAREKAEIEGQHWEACEREETERKITEALEWAETQKKQNNVCEAEESERQTKAAHEQAENEKNQKAVSEREKNERRMKEACEQAEIEKRLKFAVEETEKHLKQSLEQTEMEKSKKPASDESQKHLNESCAQEEIEMREKNFRLEDEKRFREAREREEKEKCFKEVLVKKEKLLNGPPGSDRNEKISVGALEKEEIEMSEKEVKENGQNIREAYESNGVDKRSKRVYLHEGSYLKVKAANETGGRKKEMENVVELEEMREKSKQAFKRNESEKLTVQGEEHAELQKACVVKSTHETKSESSLAQEVYVDVGAERVKPSEEVSKVDLRKEVSAQTASKGEETDKFSSDKKKIETETELNGGRKVADPFKMEKVVAANVFLSPATAQPNSKNQEFHIIKENVNNSYYAETRIKSGAAAVGASNKLSVSEMASEREDVEGPATNTKSEVSHLGKRGKILEQPQMSSDQEMNDMIGNPPKMVNRDVEKEREFLSSQTSEGNGEGQKEAPAVKSNPYSERGNQNVNGEIKSEERQQEERLKKESELEKERQRKMEEEREREREREKDRMAVERATYEFRERAYVDARERAERAAIERATAEARQRALAEARERLERACAEARENTFTDKQSMDARIRAERAAVERATTEARERAFEKTMSGNFFPDSSNRASSNAKNSEIVEGESAQRCKARLERHQRTAERAAKALAEKNKRDLLAQREQAEKNRLAESLGADVKRWSSGKEGNLRALLSTLQYILGPDSGWQPIPLTDVITSAAVKKAYRKATLCVHPDKLQQRGASIQQKYICEKVFDLLKEAWNKFNSEER